MLPIVPLAFFVIASVDAQLYGYHSYYSSSGEWLPTNTPPPCGECWKETTRRRCRCHPLHYNPDPHKDPGYRNITESDPTVSLGSPFPSEAECKCRCMGAVEFCRLIPHSNPTTSPNEYWSLTTNGKCVIEGACIKSHPQAGITNYSSNERCDFVAKKNGMLTALSFETEARWDWLSVGETVFHGPSTLDNYDEHGSSENVLVATPVEAGTPVIFQTDSGYNRKGFEVCYNTTTTDFPGGQYYKDLCVNGYGKYYWSSGGRPEIIMTQKSCYYKCWREPECKTASWHKDKCYFSTDGIESAESSDEGCDSWEKTSDPPSPEPTEAEDFPGGLYYKELCIKDYQKYYWVFLPRHNMTQKSCYDRCWRESKCNTASWYKDKCYFSTNGIESARYSDEGCDLWHRTSDPPPPEPTDTNDFPGGKYYKDLCIKGIDPLTIQVYYYWGSSSRPDIIMSQKSCYYKCWRESKCKIASWYHDKCYFSTDGIESAEYSYVGCDLWHRTLDPPPPEPTETTDFPGGQYYKELCMKDHGKYYWSSLGRPEIIMTQKSCYYKCWRESECKIASWYKDKCYFSNDEIESAKYSDEGCDLWHRTLDPPPPEPTETTDFPGGLYYKELCIKDYGKYYWLGTMTQKSCYYKCWRESECKTASWQKDKCFFSTDGIESAEYSDEGWDLWHRTSDPPPPEPTETNDFPGGLYYKELCIKDYGNYYMAYGPRIVYYDRVKNDFLTLNITQKWCYDRCWKESKCNSASWHTTSSHCYFSTNGIESAKYSDEGCDLWEKTSDTPTPSLPPAALPTPISDPCDCCKTKSHLQILSNATVTLDPRYQWFHSGAAENVINGDSRKEDFTSFPSTRMGHCLFRTEFAPWVQIDLGSPKLVYGVTIWHKWGDQRQYCSQGVQASNDGETWTTIFDIGHEWGPNERPEGHHYAFQPQVMRYIRHFAGPSTLNDGVHFLRIEVEGVEVTDTNRLIAGVGEKLKMDMDDLNSVTKDYIDQKTDEVMQTIKQTCGTQAARRRLGGDCNHEDLNVQCGFYQEGSFLTSGDPRTLYVEEGNRKVNTGFFYNIKGSCSDLVDISISVRSNEIDERPSAFLTNVISPGGEEEVPFVFVAPRSCREAELREELICEPSPSGRRFYDIQVTATDGATGYTVQDTCWVFVSPKGNQEEGLRGGKGGGELSKQEQQELFRASPMRTVVGTLFLHHAVA